METKEPISVWTHPAKVTENNFVYKSLSQWAVNVAIGCGHKCHFCYVPDASTNKMGDALKEFGVADPDAEWGEYVLVRPLDVEAFRRSVKSAERTPVEKLKKDGNRAVMFCSTTDAFQIIKHKDPTRRKELQKLLDDNVEKMLTIILTESTLNVRILTRGPSVKKFFPLFKKFGNRLMFGMSLPTLDNRLAALYEPGAPAPSQRLATLQAAKAQDLNIYVAVAPTYPECTREDLTRTLKAVRALDPLTIYHEPINIRAENVERIAKHAQEIGVPFKRDVFADAAHWREYAILQLRTVENIAKELNLSDRLHLWPDKSLGAKSVKPSEPFLEWLGKYWNRISEWPK